MSQTVYRNNYSSAQYYYEVSFDKNGGDTAPSDATARRTTSDQYVTLTVQIPAEKPTRTNYKFLGYAESAAGAVVKQPGNSVSTNFTRSATLTNTTTYYDGADDTYYVVREYTTTPQQRYKTYYAIWELAVYPPTITQNPSDVTTFIGGSAVLEVAATASLGTLTYQWQSSTDGGSTWANIAGATSTQYTADTSVVGVTYYRAIVTTTSNGESASETSSSAVVTVNDVAAPVFTSQPASATYAVGTVPAALTAVVTSNAPMTYAWSKSTDGGSTWSAISGAITTVYTPSTSTAGVTQYKLTATASGGSQTKSTDSNAAIITVYAASTPVFVYDVSSFGATYNATDFVTPLNGTATATGTITYQWQRSSDNGLTWYDISEATSPIYTPTKSVEGTSLYKVIATATAGTSTATATSTIATITIVSVILTPNNKWTQYLSALKKPFVKLARLDFLNPNGSVAFSLDNNARNARSKAFIQSGDLSVNMQNGQRRTATVTLANLNGEYDYNVNKLWFGQQVRLWEGMILPNGEDFYISQGVFYVKDPEESFEPGLKQTTLSLVDKWAYLDGTLFGNLDGTYEVPVGSNIFNAIKSVLDLDRGNGQKVDSTPPVFTAYYNGKTTTLPDGTTAALTDTPYTYRCDSENGTYADIILEMNTMLAGWIGYDSFGQLRLSPSQDDILDQTKPIQWEFTPLNSTFLGATYSVKNSEVYNDIIIIGESLSEYGQTAGRATNYDPMSDTNVNIIGLKTKRYQQSGYYTQDICESLAVFKLKRESVLKKSVSIKCSQMFHIQENNLVTIQRTDKPGAPVERHLITGFSRPIAQTGPQVINAVSVQDFPVATITSAP